jgi:hypothetical protein
MSGVSGASIDATRVAFASATVVSDAEMTVGSTVILTAAVSMDAISDASVYGERIQRASVLFDATSSMVVVARKKWETEVDVSETWTPITDISETWTTTSS